MVAPVILVTVNPEFINELQQYVVASWDLYQNKCSVSYFKKFPVSGSWVVRNSVVKRTKSNFSKKIIL